MSSINFLKESSKGISLKGTFIPKLLNNPLSSCSLMDLDFLIKAFSFCFVFIQFLDFYFLYFFYTSINMITLFYFINKIFYELFKSLNLWFLAHYLFKKISLWLIFDSTEALEIKTILFNLDFSKNTILSCFFFFFLVFYLYFLFSVAIAQSFNPIAELIIHLGIPIS